MNDSVFSVLAAEDLEGRTASRKSTIAANARVLDKFGAFIQQSSSGEERDQRIALISDDIRDVVVSACADHGGDPVSIEKAVKERLAKTCVCGGDPSKCQCNKGNKREASTHESRRPRLCPYHKQVVDISLAQGEPKAGFDAMAQHSWSDKHCESDEYGGEKCKFKPEMTTQSYWTDRTDAAREKREERQRLEEEQRVQESPTEPIEEQEHTEEPSEYTIDTTEWESDGGSTIDTQLQDAPSAVASDPLPVESSVARTAASYQAVQLSDGSGRWKVVGPGGTSQGVYDTQQEAQAECNMLNRGVNNQNQPSLAPVSRQAAPNLTPGGLENQYFPTSPQQGAPAIQDLSLQQMMQAQPPGAAQQPGTTPAMQQAQQMMQAQQPGAVAPVQPAPGAAQIPPHPNNPGQQQQGVLNQIAPAGGQQAPGVVAPVPPAPGALQQQFAGTRVADNEVGLGGPSPKMDKRKWTPENLKPRLDTEGPNSPVPTKEIDISEPVVQDKSDGQFTTGEGFLEGTRSVTETQDVTKTWKNPGSGATKTFDGAGQTSPVTSATHEAASMTRQHFNLIADALKSAPGAGSELANHFADHLNDTNPNFNRERFLNAATPEDSEKESSHNPLYDILDEDFVRSSQVTSAISQYREE